MNILSIDTEFSSFYSADRMKSGELLQLGIVPYVDGIKQEPFNEYCRPLTKMWNKHAEEVHKISRRRAETFQHPMEMAKKLQAFLDKHDNAFFALGHNCKSDKNYVERLISDSKNTLQWHTKVRNNWIDSYKIAMKIKSQLGVKNLKLETLARYFGITIEAHDALSDADATYQLYQMLDSYMAAKSGSQQSVGGLSEIEKRRKYIDLKYVSMGGDGTVFLTEFCTQDREALRIVLSELWDVYGATH